MSRIGSKVFGDKTSYYFFLDGVEGLFKMGGKRPTFKEGGQVEFDVNEKNAVEWNSIKSAPAAPEPVPTAAPQTAPQAAPVPIQTAAPPSAARAPVTVPFDRYRNRDFAYEERRNINRQFSRRLAFEETAKLLDLGVFTLPKTENKRYEAYMVYVAKQTEAIYADVVADHAPQAPVVTKSAPVPAGLAPDEVTD
ncbi:MAG: hypothetical protein ACYDB1_01070 [Acidiferrobacteraceae bacterium]